MSDPMLQLQAAAAGGDVRAQFHFGMALARHGDTARARIWYQRAAGAGSVPARRELALLQLFGIGVARDVATALADLAVCAEADDPDAHYWLARQAFATGSPDAVTQAIARLDAAARAGHKRAARTRALIHADKRETAEADRLLGTSMSDGDRHSAALLAQLKADSGSPRAPSGSASREGAGLSLDSATPTVLNEAPYIAIVDDVLSSLDCRHLIELAQQAKMRPAMTVHPDTGELFRNEFRTSSSCSILPFHEDPWALWLQRRMCALVGVELKRAEQLSVLHYAPGQEYLPHRDYLQPSSLDSPEGVLGGQRTSTVFVYLNDVGAGGETDFPQLDVNVTPRLGRAVVFSNVLPDGQPDPRTLHAGRPVIEGEKWLATLWIRERPVRAV